MAYELWDMETANLIGDFPTEEAALTAIRQGGLGAVATLALAFEDEMGETHSIAVGPALAQRAQASRHDSRAVRSRLVG
ncbi:MAG: hypothetical protein ACRDJW_19405 [Thermomicrobiales bacterium]